MRVTRKAAQADKGIDFAVEGECRGGVSIAIGRKGEPQNEWETYEFNVIKYLKLNFELAKPYLKHIPVPMGAQFQ